MAEYQRIRICNGKHTFHMDFDTPMEESDICGFLDNILKERMEWHPEKRSYREHCPVYLNRLDDDMYQIYGVMSGIAAKQHSGPQNTLWVADIHFLDHERKLITQKLMPAGRIDALYDMLVDIYTNEIKNPPCEQPVLYYLYVFLDEKQQMRYLSEKLMHGCGDVPAFQDRMRNPCDISRELSWPGRRIERPHAMGIYQMIIEARWSYPRDIQVHSCVPMCKL